MCTIVALLSLKQDRRGRQHVFCSGLLPLQYTCHHCLTPDHTVSHIPNLNNRFIEPQQTHFIRKPHLNLLQCFLFAARNHLLLIQHNSGTAWHNTRLSTIEDITKYKQTHHLICSGDIQSSQSVTCAAHPGSQVHMLCCVASRWESPPPPGNPLVTQKTGGADKKMHTA